eukprot:gene2646-5023_t
METIITTLQSQAKPSQGKPTTAKDKPVVKYQAIDRALWLHLPGPGDGLKNKHLINPEDRKGDNKQLIHPVDRKGDVSAALWSTAKLEVALQRYRKAVDDATNALLAGAQLSIVTAALKNHVDGATRQQWTLPTLATSSNVTELKGLWPYWRSVSAPDTVKNDLVIDRMLLLTGPNMAGKSTLLRSVATVSLLANCGFMVPAKNNVAAVSLLANCGLMVPAQSATVPGIDALILRNFSGDSPLEGKSSFAMEMDEMRSVCADGTKHSLVLLDELGKGTEVRAGTAIAQAMLEELCREECTGIFATHLHDLVELTQPLADRGQLGYVCMQVENEKTSTPGLRFRRKPTWKVSPHGNSCFETLALEVAHDMGVGAGVLTRASEVMQLLRERRGIPLSSSKP